MGVISRISTLVQAKMSKLLDRAEDPRETLDYSYERQREMLQNVKRGIVEVVTSKKRLELQDRAFLFAARRITELDLPVKLAKCAVGFDRRKILIIYSSEERASLRDLVRETSDEFHLRVEAKLVGVRDETKLMGGIGPCGLTLCCSTWLRGFHPVTIKMAKLQGITPNPAKLTGMCGRLKCCIAYELEGGIEGARRLGSRGPDKKPAPAPPQTPAS